MSDLELEAYTKARLRAVRQHAAYGDQRPRRSWRSRAAHMLRDLADGLEPQPVPAHPVRLRA